MDSGPGVEAELIERARNGDVAAFEGLVHVHQAAAFRTAWVVSSGADDSDDAAQEGFMKAFDALPRFRAGTPFRPWLLTIVANEARNRRRSAGRRAALALRAPGHPGADDVAASPEAVVLARERRAALLGALERLSEPDRQVITFRYLLQFSGAETAAALRVPAGTVKSRLSRALDRLRGAVETLEASP